MLTLGQCRTNAALKRIAGKCATSQDFADLVNESIERGIKRGAWFETEQLLYTCVYSGCFVMPRYVLEVRKVNMCHKEMPVHSVYYQFMGAYQQSCGGYQNWKGTNIGFTQLGTSPVFQDVLGEGRLIRAYARAQSDLGKHLTLFGTDNNGQPLNTYNPDGSVTPGVTLTLAAPFASTPTYVRHIDRVNIDLTQDLVDVYAYNPTTNLLEPIAQYEPTDTCPSFAKYQLSMPWPYLSTGSVQPNCCGTPQGILAMVKLKYIPAINDTDLVLINDVSALKKLMMSIIREDAGDIQGAKAFEADAVHELNRQSEDHVPEDQFAASDNTFGPHVWSNQTF
jgi:hypothetical protein